MPTSLVNQSAPTRLAAYGCLALSMALVGGYVALSKPLVAALPVFVLAWLRFAIGATAMVHWLRRPDSEAPMVPTTHRLLFLGALVGNVLFSVFMLYGVSMTSAVSAGVIMATIPAAVALLSWLALGERIGLRIWTAVTCAVAGIALLALADPVDAPDALNARAWVGNLLVLAAVFCEAAYTVIGKKLTGSLNPRRITALINLWGLVLTTPLAAVVAWDFDFAAVPLGIWPLLVFYALAASVWSVWLWMTGLRVVPAAHGGVFTVFLPVMATLVGVYVLAEPVAATQLLALALALIGVIVATLPERRPIPPPDWPT